ncbi:abortive infection family protein [Salinibacter sp.]|uniref:abortive infection family protein n=1 Tax=Salinibacter sp. TaxID=2065818 RepID=UPI0021E87135|nr:abortive infection family protein [Salinibacter sp.]
MKDEALMRDVETLQNIMIDLATGGDVDGDEYKRLRRRILSSPKIKEELPDFVETCRSIRQFWSFIKKEFGRYEPRRQYIWSEFAPALNKLENRYESPADDSISDALKELDTGYVDEVWGKALQRKATDPEGAVTAARTLLESVCKSIMDEMGVSYDDSDDLPKLYHRTAEALNLAPSQHSEELFKKILGNCQSVVGTLGAIRNSHSDAHGDGKVYYKPAPRHAELTVNLAGSMAMFLVRTWENVSESV